MSLVSLLLPDSDRSGHDATSGGGVGAIGDRQLVPGGDPTAAHRLDPVRGVVNAAILSVPLWIGIGAAVRRLLH